MKIYFLLLTLLCVVGVRGEKQKNPKPEKRVETKLKREAALSVGSGYNGPSYKYLPPIPSLHSEGSDTYNGHQAIESSSTFERGSSGLFGYHGHGDRSYGNSGPQIETYIVQTQTAHDDYNSPQSGNKHGLGSSSALIGRHGFSGTHGGSHSQKFAAQPAFFSGGRVAHLNSYGLSSSHGHSPMHKVKAIVIPAHGFVSSGHGAGSGSGRGRENFSRFGGHQSGYNDADKGSHFSAASGGDFIGHSSSSAAAFNAGQFSGLEHSEGSQGHSFSNENGQAYYAQSLGASHRGSNHLSTQEGYSYETPSSTNSHSFGHDSTPSRYGPSNILSPPHQSTNSVHKTPAYAVGHKGLGHFGFSASKPQALNTHFIDSNRYGSSYSSQDHSVVSAAPFKPSLFLGSSQESTYLGGPISTGSLSTLSKYLPPPTADSYDYPSPPALYNGPSERSHGTETGATHDSENSYLPPQAVQIGYGQPAAAEDTYLPTHH